MLCSEMKNNNILVCYKVFESHKNLFAYTTVKETLGIPNVRFSDSEENRVKLAEVLDISPGKMVFPGQTHTSCVLHLNEYPRQPINDTDALVTNVPGLCICVQTADCVPILLFDPVKNVVSAVHAGWRGTVGKIVEGAVENMKNNYGSKPENILAAIGPSISSEIYEVGDEVVAAVHRSIPNSERTLRKNRSGKFHFDLWEANRQLLRSSGIPSGNIEIPGECTYLEKEKYYSARRDGIDTGRLVSGIMIL